MVFSYRSGTLSSGRIVAGVLSKEVKSKSIIDLLHSPFIAQLTIHYGEGYYYRQM
jgi:hypothetical protein